MATRTDNSVLTGGQVVIEMDGQVIGFANSLTCNDNYNLTPINVIGQYQPIEFVPTAASHNISIDTIVMRGDSLVRHNLEPMTGGSYGLLGTSGANVGGVVGVPQIYADTDDKRAAMLDSTGSENGGTLTLLDGKKFDIGVKTDTHYIVKYIDCYCTGGTFTIGQNNIVGRTVTFVALDRRGQLDSAGDDDLGNWAAG